MLGVWTPPNKDKAQSEIRIDDMQRSATPQLSLESETLGLQAPGHFAWCPRDITCGLRPGGFSGG